MFQALYVIWFLLPLLLILLTIWALVKPWFGVAGKEYSSDYAKQAGFCLAGFFIAVGLDQLELEQYLSLITEDGSYVVRWLLYPAVLVGLAYLMKILKAWFGKDKPDDLSFGLARYRR